MCGFQHVPHVCFYVPSSMLQRCGITDTELRVAPERHDASTLLERSRHYQQYIQENLVEHVPTDLTNVNLSTSCLFYFLCVVIDCPSQFEGVGSPIADEVMDEQADTRRTETEMTKHASQTQYTMPIRSEDSMNASFNDISLLDRLMYYWASAVQIPIEQQMYFDISHLPSFTPSDASTFLHFKDTNFECQQQSIYTTLICLKDFYHEK